MKNFMAFVFGGMFAVGLILSGLANPAKIMNFLDIFGTWDPTLAFTMGGAILVAIIPFQKAVRQAAPKTVFGEEIDLPKNKTIDKKLIIGSGLFGIGWGIAGICPGPAMTLVGLGYYEGLYFVVAMVLGMWLYKKMAQGA